MHHTLSVIYEDNHLLVVDKPNGLATMGVAPSEVSLVRIAKDYLKRKYRKPGNVYLGVVSRLDSHASGVIVLARTSKAAARLAAQFRSGDVAKRYWAIVAGNVQPEEATLVDWLIKDSSAKRVRVVPQEPGIRCRWRANARN
jgi:23S rRNA pseudouridine1911/1915/1917 synthase